MKALANARRGARACAKVVAAADECRVGLEAGGFRVDPIFLTLTYGRGNRWQPEHLRQFFTHVRNYCRRRGWDTPYQRVAEIQEGRFLAGAAALEECVHHHVLLWLPKGARLPKPDRCGWWPHGMTRIERATKPVGYLVKYATKLNNRELAFPKHLRLFNVCGLDSAQRVAVHRAGLPKWLREATRGRTRRLGGGWYVDESTGEVVQCPFEFRLEHLGGTMWRAALYARPPP